jgi:hypothetical protein
MDGLPAAIKPGNRPVSKITGLGRLRCGKPPRQRGEHHADGDLVAAEFAFLTNHEATILAPAVIYACLIAVIALTAVFSSRPARRKAALEVLRLLLPGRRNIRAVDRWPPAHRAARRPDPPGLPPPNQ